MTRFQTVAAGETWAVHGSLKTGQTVSIKFYNGVTGALISSSSTCTEIGGTGVYRSLSSELTVDPTVMTQIVWIMTGGSNGDEDRGDLVVGGYVNDIDAATSTRSSHDAGDVWDETTAAHTTSGTMGKKVGDLELGILAAIGALNNVSIADVQTAMTNQGYTAARAPNLDDLDASVASRSSHSAADAADAVWDEVLSGHLIAGSTGAKLNALELGVISAIAALNNVSIADVQTALTNQGYTTARSLLLDNLDAAVSSRATVAAILSASLLSGDSVDIALSRADNIDQSVTITIPALIAALNDPDAATIADAVWDEALSGHLIAGSTGAKLNALEIGILSAISGLNNISIADVQTALTNQGYTSVRAALLDNLDAAISAVVTAIGALNNISIADVQTALTNQGYTAARAVYLDNLVQILVSVEKVRKVTTNRVVVDVAFSVITVYEDDDTTPAFTMTVSPDRRTRTP